MPRQRAELLHVWGRRTLHALGVEERICGQRPRVGVIVANHVSYLDILLVLAAAPCVLVSKKEVRKYPLVGLAAKIGGTIFLDRKRSAAIHQAGTEMDETLKAGCPVAFFPEGTTTGGGELLRFRPALFAAPARLGLPVNTAALRYEIRGGGDAGELVCFWKDHVLLPHLLRLLMLPGVNATLQFGDSFVPARSPGNEAARDAASRAQHSIRQMLAATCGPTQ